MKNIVPTFEHYLLERMAIPDTSFVGGILTKVKKSLMDAKSNAECAKILRAAFRSKWINVRISDKEPDECTESEWSISWGSTVKDDRNSIDGSIVNVYLGKYFNDRIKDAKSSSAWSAFCKSFENIIAHEYVHKYQVKFMTVDSLNATWANSDKDYDSYLKIKQEIQAYAFGAVKEFIAKGYTPDEVIQRIKKPIDPDVVPPGAASDSYMRYLKFSTHDPKTFKKFLDYMYDFVSQFKKE